MSKRNEKKSRKRGGFIAGALIGGAIALLAAPVTGRETRAKLKDVLGGSGGFDFRAQADKLKDAMGAGKESAADQSEALKRKIEETRSRLREQMDEVG